jgi:hypothetical protein
MPMIHLELFGVCMRRVVAWLLLSSSVAFPASGVECIKPKYARDALRTSYLDRLNPGIDTSLIRSRTKQDTWRVIDRAFLDVHRCFGKIGGCPSEKKEWTRLDHASSGEALINALWQSEMLRTDDMRYLQNSFRFTIEESECSDF